MALSLRVSKGVFLETHGSPVNRLPLRRYL